MRIVGAILLVAIGLAAIECQAVPYFGTRITYVRDSGSDPEASVVIKGSTLQIDAGSEAERLPANRCHEKVIAQATQRLIAWKDRFGERCFSSSPRGRIRIDSRLGFKSVFNWCGTEPVQPLDLIASLARCGSAH